MTTIIDDVFAGTSRWIVACGDNRDLLPFLPDESIDSIVTDPPAGIGFMGKMWDKAGKLGVSGGMAMPATTSSRNPSCRICGGRKRHGAKTKGCTCAVADWNEEAYRHADREAFIIALTATFREAFRVLKPGGHAFVWALPRTSSWTATALEDAGFEIRDEVPHLFGCLSDDTEILTVNGWERYQDLAEGRLALCYDPGRDAFQWQPIQEVYVYPYRDTAFRLRGDRTDQIVSRGHRCLVERGGGWGIESAEALQREEGVPVLEDVCGLLQKARELRLREVRPLPSGVPSDGAQGRVRGGAQAGGGDGDRALPPSAGGCASRQPQPNGQPAGEPHAVRDEPRPQAVRGARYTRTDLVRVEPFAYDGTVWCVRVPSGCFVARRAGKAFVTGNSGFPKSLNVSKAIDKAAGAERDTADAKRWSGWGTALKPAHEVWILARKPIDGTVAANVLKYGTGALNIDASRVATSESLNGGAYSGERREKTTEWQSADRSEGKGSGLRQGIGEFSQPAGRWPPNAMFSHCPECEESGTRKVRGHPGYPNGPGGKTHHYSSDKRSAEVRTAAWAPTFTNADSTETVTMFSCLAGCPSCGLARLSPAGGEPPACDCGAPMVWACPVAELDMQSGVTTSGVSTVEHEAYDGESTTGFIRGRSGPSNQHGGSGGASRFFPVFHPFIYQAKASTSEKSAGIDEKNSHPTVKSVELMRRLCRMITPPNGIVLDMYAGSGSTGVASIAEGFRFVGLEREPKHASESRSRCALAERDLCEERTGQVKMFADVQAATTDVPHIEQMMLF